MNCPKCNGETESELQHSYFIVGEVVDVSRCLNCGFKFYEVYRKQGKWKEWYEDVEGLFNQVYTFKKMSTRPRPKALYT